MNKVSLLRRALSLVGRVLMVTMRSISGVFYGAWQ